MECNYTYLNHNSLVPPKKKKKKKVVIKGMIIKGVSYNILCSTLRITLY
jgi:hypothetical protein